MEHVTSDILESVQHIIEHFFSMNDVKFNLSRSKGLKSGVALKVMEGLLDESSSADLGRPVETGVEGGNDEEQEGEKFETSYLSLLVCAL